MPSRVSAAEPCSSAPLVGEELPGLPAAPPAVETTTDSGDQGEEIQKSSSEGKELNNIDREVMQL